MYTYKNNLKRILILPKHLSINLRNDLEEEMFLSINRNR